MFSIWIVHPIFVPPFSFDQILWKFRHLSKSFILSAVSEIRQNGGVIFNVVVVVVNVDSPVNDGIGYVFVIWIVRKMKLIDEDIVKVLLLLVSNVSNKIKPITT